MPEAIKYLDTQDKLRLGGGLSSTQVAALDAGMLRAKEQLELAATLSVDSNANTVKIVNHTGHKLISGYPEGRRMWLKTTWMNDAGEPVRVDGDYGEIGVTVNGSAVRSIKDLHDPNTKIYEAHYGLDQKWAEQLVSLGYPQTLALSYDRETGAVTHTLGELATSPAGTAFETFHFVLNNVVKKDNRIPPYGMDYETARKRNALPVPADQYGGGPGKSYDYYDTVSLNPPVGATSAVIELLYQPTSWEYIQFLDLANNQPAGSFLENEGTYMLEAWLKTGMAEPYVMASTTWGDAQTCDVPAPTLQTATPGNSEVTSNWTAVSADGYNLYYDQSGKAQLVANTGAATTYTDAGLTNGQEYCYKVTAYTDTCESEFSNIICAIPNQPGQANAEATLSTGRYETSGKGKNQVTTFVETTGFAVGDAVTVRAVVIDETTGLPIPNATVSLAISGPETTTLTTGQSDANGIAEATWNTQTPNKKGNGGTSPGSYTATTTDVSLAGYTWDGVISTTQFTLQ